MAVPSVDGPVQAGGFLAEEIAGDLDGGRDVAGLEVLDLALDPLVETGRAWNGTAG